MIIQAGFGAGYLSWMCTFSTHYTNLLQKCIQGEMPTMLLSWFGRDVGNVVEALYGDLPPPIMLIGHSMGGAIAVHTAVANLVPSLLGLCMIDVVEGKCVYPWIGFCLPHWSFSFIPKSPNTESFAQFLNQCQFHPPNRCYLPKVFLVWPLFYFSQMDSLFAIFLIISLQYFLVSGEKGGFLYNARFWWVVTAFSYYLNVLPVQILIL